MKKIFYIILAGMILLTSCSRMLDIEPTDAISSSEAIKDKAGLDKATTGAYDALQQVGLYGRNRVILGDLAADNLKWTGTTLDYGQVDQNQVPIDNSFVEGLWAGAYDGINRVNNILAALPGIGGLTNAERAAFEGNALFLRALFHFELLTYFGGVPVKTTPTLDVEQVDQARNTPEEVYDRVIADLTEAEAKLSSPGDTPDGRASSYAATALLARVYLTRFHAFDNPQDAAMAISKADQVISSGEYSLAPEFELLFAGPSDEIIFKVVFSVQDRNRLAEYNFPRSLAGRYEVAPEDGFVQDFDPLDSLRRKACLAVDSVGDYYAFKYRDLSGGSDPVFVIRLAEMHLIKAEALAFTNGEEGAIRQNIDIIRERAGLSPTPASNFNEFKLAIENERRFEFAFEGHRWFDLVRTGRAVIVLGIDPNFVLYPIPLSEMTTNGAMEQNPGY
jgi:hypothetical protein